MRIINIVIHKKGEQQSVINRTKNSTTKNIHLTIKKKLDYL